MSAGIGKFITIEGGEGAGKSTNIRFIQEYLERQGKTTLLTREPGGTEMGESLRELILREHTETVDPLTELLLIFAARAQHLSLVIRPALARGEWVICDRFTDATYAYQGGGRGLDFAKIELLEKLVQNGLQPDLTVLLDLKPETGLQRASRRGDLDRIEKEQIPFFAAVRETYLKRAREHGDRCVIINADAALERVQSDVAAALERLLVH